MTQTNPGYLLYVGDEILPSYILAPSSRGAKWFRCRVSIHHPLGFKDGTPLKVLVGTIIISHEKRIPSFSPHQFFSRNVCHVRSAWWVLNVVDGVFCTNSAFAPRLRYQIVFLFMLEGLSCTQEPRSLGIRSDM